MTQVPPNHMGPVLSSGPSWRGRGGRTAGLVGSRSFSCDLRMEACLPEGNGIHRKEKMWVVSVGLGLVLWLQQQQQKKCLIFSSAPAWEHERHVHVCILSRRSGSCRRRLGTSAHGSAVRDVYRAGCQVPIRYDASRGQGRASYGCPTSVKHQL